MVAGPPSLESAILQHHVTTVAESTQKTFVFYTAVTSKYNQQRRLTRVKVTKKKE